MKEKRITVVGHYGMSLLMDVPRFTAVGETVEALALETEPGGKGYNQAIAASRLGAKVDFITAVGDDDFGAGCERDLLAEGVEGRYITVFPGQRTACAVVLNSADRQSEVYVYPGAIRSVTPADIQRYAPVLEASSLLLLQNEISPEALRTAIEIGSAAGVEMIYNPAPARPMPKELLSGLVCVTPNETEAAILTGQDPEKPLDVDRAIETLHAMGVANVIITLGANGSVVSNGTTKEHISPIPVKAVSTTGAGDSYNAALAVYYLRTGDLFTAAKYATAASALQVSRPGVIAALPYQEEADKLFHDVYGKQ